MPLCGAHDNLTDIEADPTANHGNFWALLNFRVEAGDDILGDHLAHAPRNATCTSSVIQNQFINILANQIQQNIISKVKVAQWFTVISDEVTDASNKEQLSIVLRYVDQEMDLIREDFISFLECDTGPLAKVLLIKFWVT